MKGSPVDMTRAATDPLSAFHRVFDLFYPTIRLVYEKGFGNRWFDRITPTDEIPEEIWLGGAPTYDRDYAFLKDAGIAAVMNIRAERPDDTALYDAHDITHVRYFVPDVGVPPDDVLTDGVAWINKQVKAGRPVLVHCAKGRGRSAAMLAAYLMGCHGMSFDEVELLLTSRRKLVKLESRHRTKLEAWLRGAKNADARHAVNCTEAPTAGG